MISPFDTITQASEAAKKQFSVLGKQEDNAEVLKELAGKLIVSLANLIHMAGGDNDYIQPWKDGIPNDIDLCFRAEMAAREDVVKMFKPRRELGVDIARGARL